MHAAAVLSCVFTAVAVAVACFDDFLSNNTMAIALRGARLALAARCATRRLCSTSSAPAAPSRTQLVRLGIAAGVPFVGFGIADNGIMILAGDYIDGTLGVKFGLSTMAAAGIGNLISDVVGVSMGEVIETQPREAAQRRFSSTLRSLTHGIRLWKR